MTDDKISWFYQGLYDMKITPNGVQNDDNRR